jgi:hypothetical protein
MCRSSGAPEPPRRPGAVAGSDPPPPRGVVAGLRPPAPVLRGGSRIAAVSSPRRAENHHLPRPSCAAYPTSSTPKTYPRPFLRMAIDLSSRGLSREPAVRLRHAFGQGERRAANCTGTHTPVSREQAAPWIAGTSPAMTSTSQQRLPSNAPRITGVANWVAASRGRARRNPARYPRRPRSVSRAAEAGGRESWRARRAAWRAPGSRRGSPPGRPPA